MCMQYDEFVADVDNLAFNEAPVNSAHVASGTIDTSAVDAYRQGIEIRTQVHYCKGVVKITSGDPGHMLRRYDFGAGTNADRNVKILDKDRFNPVTYVATQCSLGDARDVLRSLTFPIEIGEDEQASNVQLNGIVEPLVIRDAAAFTSIESPFFSHDTRGTLMSGNEDVTLASDQALSIDEFAPEKEQTSYVDMVDMLNGVMPLDGTFDLTKATLEPFTDERPIRNAMPLSGSFSEMLAALSHMTGSTDNYVAYGEQCASTGFSFHNDGIGVDSISFGELSY